MSKFKSEKVMPRYFAIAVVLTLIGFAIVGKAMYIMTAKKDYWTRGNILSCDGQLMASSLPEYKIYMDFQAGTDDSIGVRKRDSIWAEKIDSIAYELNQIFPTRTVNDFKDYLLAGKRKVMKNGKVGARHWPIWPRRIDYNTFCEVRKFSTGRSSIPVITRSEHLPNVPSALCSALWIVQRTAWNYLSIRSYVVPMV